MSGATRDLTRGGLLARNVALNIGGWTLPAIAALIAVPPLVRGLGDARFGVLALAWTTLGYFSLFDLGMGRAVTHGVADRIGSGREDEIGAVVWTSLATLVPVGVLGFAILFSVAPMLAHRVLQVPDALLDETIVAFRILAVAIPFAGTAAALRGVLEARQRFGAINMLRVPHGLLTFLGPLVALPFSHSLVPAVTILTLGRVALCAATFAVCTRVIPHFGQATFRWSRSVARGLFSFGGWMTVTNVVSPLMNSLDRFVVGAALSVGVVTYYAAPSELATKMWLFTAALHPVFFPAMATTGVRDAGRTAALFDRLLRVTFAGLFLPTLAFVLLSRDLLTVWLGAHFALQSATVLQVLAAAVFVNTLGQGALVLIQGLGRPDITGKYHLVELPLYAAALWLLLPRFGIVGVAIAWGARAVVDAVALLVTCPVLLPESRSTIRRALLGIAGALFALGAAYAASDSRARFVVMGVVAPLWAWIAWRWLLTPQERSAPVRALTTVLRPERA